MNNKAIEARLELELPTMVFNQFLKLDLKQQYEFLEEYNRKKISAGMAYLCWLCFGFHYLYLRKYVTQVLFTCTIGGLLGWWCVDFFRLSSLVKHHNRDVAIVVMKDLKLLNL